MRNLFALIALVLFVSGSADAQSSVTLRGTVSETVALSVSRVSRPARRTL